MGMMHLSDLICAATNPGNIRCAVVIPALNPIAGVVDMIRSLLACGISRIIVVNDGSDASFQDTFERVAQLERCVVLVHSANQGKGRALKTAFRYFMEHCPDLDGVVTADADGQHSVEDICTIGRRLSSAKGSILLGVRNFKEDNVPPRSYIGNSITSLLFRLLYGSRINDTQTGLRGIPAKELAWMADLKGERFEYELNMLIRARRRHLDFTLIPIKTMYFDHNAGSHYSTVKDSARIFLILVTGFVHYSASAVGALIIDLSCFFLLNRFVFAGLAPAGRIFASTAVARVISSLFNFAVNKKLIFSHKGNWAASAARYYTLCLFQMLASAGLVYGFSLFWKVDAAVIKVIVDFILYILSYQVQLRWVFRGSDAADAL
jgi:glycosyltransferase involved in cell wall biosynthesis